MMKHRSILLAALLALAATTARAQVFTPTFQSPYRGSDVGLYLVDDVFADDLGIEGILRRDVGRRELGLRLGLTGDLLLLGIDSRNPLAIAGTAPLAIALTLGAQGAVGDGSAFGGQAGLSIGHAFRFPEATVTPYVHPRVAVLAVPFSTTRDVVEVLADLGVDVELRPNFVLRFGASLAEGADFGFGLALRR